MNFLRKLLILISMIFIMIPESYSADSKAQLLLELQSSIKQDKELVAVIKDLERQKEEQQIESHLLTGQSAVALGAGILFFKLAQNASGHSTIKAIMHFMAGVMGSYIAINKAQEFSISASKAHDLFEQLEEKREELLVGIEEREIYIETIR